MRKKPFLHSPLLYIFSAALGQYFLSSKGNALTLASAFLFYGLALWGLRGILKPGPGTKKALPLKAEAALFAGVFTLALAFRTFRIDVFPCGISVDQAIPGCGGLAVLEGWRPFLENPFYPFPALMYYPIAAWFKFFTPTQAHLALYCVAISMGCFCLVYWTFRQLAGTGSALFTACFLAVSWWDADLGRWASPHLLPGLFIYGALGFWLRGLSTGKAGSYWASGFLLGLGSYTYYSFRPFPLAMMALAWWEVRRNPALFRRHRAAWLGMLLVFAATTAPLLWHWAHEPSFGQGYPGQEFIGTEILKEKSPAPIVKNVLGFLAMFNREGDPSPKQTTQGAPMLDAATGILAVLGLAMAFLNLQERSSVYPLVLFAFLSLNDVLCSTPANTCHVIALLPCVVFWAGSALWRLCLQKSLVGKPWNKAVGGAVFLLASVLNYHQLFDIQARNPDNPAVFDLGPTLAGREIAGEGFRYDFVLSPRFALHWTVRFLASRHPDDFRQWNWPRDAALPPLSPGKEGVVFMLGGGEEGIFRFVKSLFPQSPTQTLRDDGGAPLVYTVSVSREELLASRGLKGIPPGSNAWNGPLFPKGPLQGDFSGNLFVGQTGPHRFWAEVAGNSSLKIDGHPVPAHQVVTLERGFHSLEIQLEVLDASKIHLWFQEPNGAVGELDSSRLTPLPVNRGLLARYYQGEIGKGPAAFSQWDPVVNFTNRTELALFTTPLGIRWEGQLWAPMAGFYHFLALTETSDRAQLWMDGKALAPAGATPSAQVELGRGWHRLRLDFQMGGDFESAISLAWEKPGEGRYEVIPAECFGMIGKGKY